MARPFYYVPVSLGASDLLGQMVGALAASATVFKGTQPALYDTLMTWALPLYGVAIGESPCSPRPRSPAPMPTHMAPLSMCTLSISCRANASLRQQLVFHMHICISAVPHPTLIHVCSSV